MEELTPITRKETFLAKAAGQEVETPTPITREEVFLDAIAKGGGGSSLPPATPADNGKVLAVKDGAWAAESNLFLVTVTLDEHYTNVADKTFSEITDAIDKGRTVICFRSGKYYVYQSSTTSEIFFMSADQSYNIIVIASNDAVALSSRAYMPPLNYSENGKILISKNSEWHKVDKKFIVTLTPTSEDFSGTMDKTISEINEAYEAGMEIWFKVGMSGMGYLMEMAGIGNGDPESTYPSFNVKFLANDTLLYVNSGYTNNGTQQTYSTTVYALTPAS